MMLFNVVVGSMRVFPEMEGEKEKRWSFEGANGARSRRNREKGV